MFTLKLVAHKNYQKLLPRRVKKEMMDYSLTEFLTVVKNDTVHNNMYTFTKKFRVFTTPEITLLTMPTPLLYP